ncbi:MAG: CpsD/CapB family tyrosine-protein kinase [Firmicutes bacterium]|nr:CpsD/CapB family tyrosine-protein kinase [Bacillota bacterium]
MALAHNRHHAEEREHDRENALRRANLVVYQDPRSPAAEAYRTLRTNIQFAGLDHPVQSVVVTSAGPGAGKSTVVANLGAAMAQAGLRCLLVDADLRRPVQHAIWERSRRIGVTTVLLGKTPLEQAVQPTEEENLFLLASGPLPPNPAELLASQAMRNLMAAAAERFDMVLYDTPPVITLTDAALIGRAADGCLLVLSAGSDPRDAALQAKDTLLRAKARILGAVLNNVEITHSRYYYYYRY